MNSHQKLASHLKPGQIYRREALAPFSKAIDRDLMTLIDKGVLKKLSAGLYYKPTTSRFGTLPPDDEKLVRSFLRDDLFLLYSWNQYNTLGLGLTQLYNRVVVYNRKRHGLFQLGGKTFDFRRPARGFPSELTPEFLLVDLINNLNELAEDADFVKTQIKKNIQRFNSKKLAWNVRQFAKIATKHFFKEINE
jgi:hypothetical protein